MKIINKIRNIFQRPKQENNDAHSMRDHDTVTVGDMHGNFLKLWDVLLDQNIFDNGSNSPITNNDYKELGRIHNNYKHYTSFYGSFQAKLAQLNQDLLKAQKGRSGTTLGLLSPQEQALTNQLRTLSNFGYTFVANQEPTDNEIKKHTIYLYLAFSPKKQLHYAMRAPDGHIIRETLNTVDHRHYTSIETAVPEKPFNSSSAQNNLALNAIIAELKKEGVFMGRHELTQQLENRRLRFEKILSKATLDSNLSDEFILFLIGDLLSDRGPNDLLTLLTLKKLICLFKARADKSSNKDQKLQSLLKIMISNHDSSFFQWYYKARYEDKTDMIEVGILPSQCVSLQGLGMELDLGLVSMKELDDLMDTVYFPHLELFSYSEDVQDDGAHLTIRTHAPSPDDEIIDTIKEMVAHVDPTNAKIYQYNTQKNVEKSINTVNKAFQAQLKTKEGLEKYIDDYKWHMVIGNIQSIANRIKESRTTQELDLESLIHLFVEVSNMISMDVPHHAIIQAQWISKDNVLLEKAFFAKILSSFGNDITQYMKLKELCKNATNAIELETKKQNFQNYCKLFVEKLKKDTTINANSNPLNTPCPYFKITNNRWTPKNKEKQDQREKIQNSHIKIDRLYGHVGLSDDPTEQQNLDNHHGHGQISQGEAYKIQYLTSKPLDSEIEDNILYVYKTIDKNQVSLFYATRTPEDDIVSDQLLFTESSEKLNGSDRITDKEYDAILSEAADRGHVVGKITSRIAQTCSLKQRKKLLAENTNATIIPTQTEIQATPLIQNLVDLDSNDSNRNSIIEEEKETLISPNTLSSKKTYLKQCNHLLKLIDNAIYTFLKKEKKKKSTQDWLGWSKQEHKANALNLLIACLMEEEMKVRTQIDITQKEIRTELLRKTENSAKEKEQTIEKQSEIISNKITDTTRLNLKKIAENCSNALAPKLALKDHWSTMGKIQQGFWRFIRSVFNPLSITSDITIKDKKEKRSLEAIASNACFSNAFLFAESLRKKSRTDTDNKRVKARGEFIKFTRKT